MPSEYWPGMPKKDHARIGNQLRGYANDLGLRDWFFTLCYEPCDEDADAQVAIIYGQKRANVSVCSTFLDLDESRQQHVLVHELLHCHLDAIEVVLRTSGVKDLLGCSAYLLFANTVHTAIENAVDAIATEITPRLVC